MIKRIDRYNLIGTQRNIAKFEQNYMQAYQAVNVKNISDILDILKSGDALFEAGEEFGIIVERTKI